MAIDNPADIKAKDPEATTEQAEAHDEAVAEEEDD